MIINANSSSVLHIGRVGENNATKVVFDISKWIEEYGKGEVTLVIEQNEVISLIGTTDPALQFEGNKVTWLVSDAFTKMEDRGKCELYYSIDDRKVKSALFDIVVTKSLDGYEEVAPTPYDGWIKQLLDAAGEVSGAVEYAARAEAAADAAEGALANINNTAETAINSINNTAETVINSINTTATNTINEINTIAENSNEKALASAADAEAWATGTRNGVVVDSSDPAFENNAKYYKDQAKNIVGGDFATITEVETKFEAGKTYTNTKIDEHNESTNAHPDIRELINKAGSAEYVINQNNKEEKYYFWFGSQEEYDNIITKDDFTLYIVDNSLTEEERRILEEHLNDFDNPHRVTAEQINVYTKDEIAELLANGTPAKLHADTHKVDGIDPLYLSIEQIEGLQNTLDNKAPSEHVHGVADITDFPAIPSWALEEEKPTYTAAEIGTYTKSEIDNLISSAVNNAIGDALGGSY